MTEEKNQREEVGRRGKDDHIGSLVIMHGECWGSERRGTSREMRKAEQGRRTTRLDVGRRRRRDG